MNNASPSFSCVQRLLSTLAVTVLTLAVSACGGGATPDTRPGPSTDTTKSMESTLSSMHTELTELRSQVASLKAQAEQDRAARARAETDAAQVAALAREELSRLREEWKQWSKQAADRVAAAEEKASLAQRAADAEKKPVAAATEYFILDGCQANVAVGDGTHKKIRFKVLLRFDGDAAKQAQAVTDFTSGGRREMLKDWASQVVAKHDLARVLDSSFPATFETDFLARFNDTVSDYKVIQAAICEIE
jgi:hypothetical protein